MKRSMLLLFVLAFTCSTAVAQTAKIAGTVTDAETGEPLPGVNVVILDDAGEPTTQGAQTNVQGSYTILNVTAGTYDLRASFIGYASQVVRGVEVQIGLTTTVTFELPQEAIGLDQVVVEATPPIIQQDVAATQRNINAEEIQAAPVQSISDVYNTVVGVTATRSHEDRAGIRGGSIEDTKFVVDGFVQGDALTSRPSYQVNLDAVKAVKVQTSGFSAEFGNARSGVVQVVTKEGGETYSGSINFQYSPPALKHFGPMMYGFDSPVVVPFVSEEAGAFSGNDFFEGWNAVANERLNPGDPHYGQPMELYARWLWRHRSPDAINELQRLNQEGLVNVEFAGNPDDYAFFQYGTTPDWNGDFTFGGPVPFTGDKVRFFTAFSAQSMEYARIFSSQPKYENRHGRVKITAHITPEIEVSVNGFWSREKGGDGGQGPDIGGWVSSDPYRVLGATNKMWYPNCGVASQRTRQYYGARLTHMVSSSTFYEAQVSYHRTDYAMLPDIRETAPVPGSVGPNGNQLTTSGGPSGVIDGRIGTAAYADSMAAAGALGWENWRDWARIRIGNYWYDEAPQGYGFINWRDVTGEYRMESCNLRVNETWTQSYRTKGKVVSQVDEHNQVMAGFSLRRDELYQFYQRIDPSVNGGEIWKSDATNWMGAFFAEDKLEYGGFIANLGLRFDWLLTSPFPLLDGEDETGPYSKFLLPGNTDLQILEKLPTERVFHLRISPRLGVSHPIGEFGKLFFNYGHFYQWPDALDLYQVNYETTEGNRVGFLGNPTVEPPRTIQYELGYEQNLFDRMSLTLTGYYKDISFEIDDVGYHPLAQPTYERIANISYEDVRGIEGRLELRRGTVPYVSGWASLNYLIESGAEYGFEEFYEDPRQQPGYASTEVSSPDVRPIVKLSLDFHTPEDFGPGASGFSLLGGISLNLLYTWQRGPHFTWNPKRIPLVENNVRWRPYQRWDLRLRKSLFSSGRFESIFYVDVINLFNQHNMTQWEDDFSYGGWAWGDHRWWENQIELYMQSLGYTDDNQNDDGSFGEVKGRPGTWKGDGVDLPAFTPWLFLEKRDVYFGLKLRF